jgi:hypothetical protein
MDDLLKSGYTGSTTPKGHPYSKDMKSRLLYGVLIFASGLLAGYLFQGETAEISPHRHGYDVRERGGGYRFISPLIECADPWATTTSLTLMHRSLTTALEDMRQKADVPLLSVYVRDFDNGPWFGLHENTDFAPASLVKVPVMLAIYKAAETDPELLTRRLRTPKPEQMDPLAVGAPADMVQPDTEYTVQELMRSMIVKSDNLATQTILQHIPSEYVSDVFSHHRLFSSISRAPTFPMSFLT